MKATLQTLIDQAAELSMSGAIRPEHDQRWSMFRQELGRAADQAGELAAAPRPIDAAAAGAAIDTLAAGLAELGARVETLAITVDATGDAVRELVANQVAPA